METVLIIIVIGIISMIFGKTKNTQGFQGRKASPGRYRDIQTVMKEITDNLPKDKTLLKPEKEATLKSNLGKLEKEYLQVRQAADTGRTDFAAGRHQADIKEGENTREEINPLVSDALQSRAIVNGFIWSEILGEPRSKKPYIGRKNSG